MRRQSWGIVLTVDEPAPLVIANVAYHIGIGAREVHLYLDRDDPTVRNVLAPLEAVTLTVCDDRYWRESSRGRAPRYHQVRQTTNANHAYARTKVDWLIHLDADEFIGDRGGFELELPFVPKKVGVWQLPVCERAYLAGAPISSIFDGCFKRPMHGGGGFEKALYGVKRPYFYKGLLGHIVGKTAFPTGVEDLSLSIHGGSIKSLSKVPKRLPVLNAKRSWLMHFDGLTPLHWCVKLLKRAQYPKFDEKYADHRRQQVQFVLDHQGDNDAVIGFQSFVQSISPEEEAQLGALGLLDSASFDPRPVIAEVLDDVPDLSVAAFDAALELREPELVEKLRC